MVRIAVQEQHDRTRYLQLRIETFNVFNVRVYGAPNTNPASANFDVVDTASQVNFPRTIPLRIWVQF